MGFFSAIGKLTNVFVNTVLIPVDVLSDTAEIIGLKEENDKTESETERRIEKVVKNLDDFADELTK
jgi:hypothetical protein